MPQVASDSTIQASTRPLPPVARPPAPDRPPSPFETLLDSNTPPAVDPPPAETKTPASDNSRPPSKRDDAQTSASSENNASSPSPSNAPGTDQKVEEKASDSDNGKASATAKTNAGAGAIVKNEGDGKSDERQKEDKADAAAQISAALTPPATQVVATATPGAEAVVGTANGDEKTEAALQTTALSAAIAAQVKQPGSAASKIDPAKTADEIKKAGTDDKSAADVDVDDLGGKFQLAGTDNALSHTGDKQQAAAGDADKPHVAQVRAEAVAGTHQQLDANAPAAANAGVDGGAQSTQLTSNALMQPANAGAPQQPTDPSVLATGPASQQNPPAVAVPVAGLAVEIAGKALAGKNRFEIRLDPPELGRIEVRLDVDRDGNVTSRLTVDRQDTLNLLQRDASGLERALQDAGLKTGDNGLQFSLRDQSMNQQQSGSSANAAQLLVKDESMPTVDVIPQSYGRLMGLGSGIDIRV